MANRWTQAEMVRRARLLSGEGAGSCECGRYTFERVDAATRVRREALGREAPGWGGISTDRPQFAIFGPDGVLADWPLVDSFEEAVKDCREFNAPDTESANEALWMRRMAGDLSA